MPRIVDIDSCLQTVKLIAAAGEIAPFPFIKGVALCAVVILENIQKAENNRSDMQELAKSIVSTLVAVRDIVIEHGPTSASHFQNICVEFQDYMTELLSKLDNERRSRGIRRILKAKKISDDISAYRQRVQAIKEDFLIRTTTMARLVLSDFQDQVNTRLGALAGAMEATERNVTSVIKDNIKEARTSGDLQSEKLQMTLCDFRQRGLYKGVVRDLIPGDIYLKASIPRICHNGSRSDFDEYHAVINDRPKIVRVFRAQADQQERVMQRFQKEVDRRLHLRHPNISQLFGVCTSPNFLALIMHSANVERHLYEVLSNESSVKGVLLFFLRMYNDLQSIANYLAEQAWIQQQEQDDSDGKTLHAQTGCFDEQGRVILNDLSLGYHPFIPFELHLGRSGVSVDANMNLYNHATRRYGVVELERLFQHSAKLERTDLRHFYESVYFLLGYNTWCCYSYPERCYNYPGYAGTGRVVTDLEEWTLHWTVKSGRQGLRRLRRSTAGLQCLLSPNRSYSFSVFHSDPFHRKHPQRLVFSWLAQRSLLPKDPHNLSSVSEDLTFCLRIQPSTNCLPSHALGVRSLSITFTVPVIISLSPPEMSWPFRFVANGIPIPPEEVEEIFQVRIHMACYSTLYVMGTFPFNSIHELNTICGFNPALDGADICRYFDLFPLEIFGEANDNMTAAIDEVQTYGSIEQFDPFESDNDYDDNAKIHAIAYWDLTVGFDDGSEGEGQDLSGLCSENDVTHFVEGIDPNFPAEDIESSLPNTTAKILPSFDSELYPHPLISLPHSRTEHGQDRKGKHNVTTEELQRDRGEEDMFCQGAYICQCDEEIVRNPAPTGMAVLLANQFIGQTPRGSGAFVAETDPAAGGFA